MGGSYDLSDGDSTDCDASVDCMDISIVPFNCVLRTLIRAKQILFLRAIRFVFNTGAGIDRRIC
jgi:hypothetical protein